MRTEWPALEPSRPVTPSVFSTSAAWPGVPTRTRKLQPELKSRGAPAGPSHVISGFGNSDPLLYSIAAVPPPILTVTAPPPRRFCHFLPGSRSRLVPVSPILTVTAPPPRRFCHFLPGSRPRLVPVSPKRHPRTRPRSPAAGSRSPSRPRRRRSRRRSRSARSLQPTPRSRPHAACRRPHRSSSHCWSPCHHAPEHQYRYSQSAPSWPLLPPSDAPRWQQQGRQLRWRPYRPPDAALRTLLRLLRRSQPLL